MESRVEAVDFMNDTAVSTLVAEILLQTSPHTLRSDESTRRETSGKALSTSTAERGLVAARETPISVAMTTRS